MDSYALSQLCFSTYAWGGNGDPVSQGQYAKFDSQAGVTGTATSAKFGSTATPNECTPPVYGETPPGNATGSGYVVPGSYRGGEPIQIVVNRAVAGALATSNSAPFGPDIGHLPSEVPAIRWSSTSGASRSACDDGAKCRPAIWHACLSNRQCPAVTICCGDRVDLVLSPCPQGRW